MAARRDDPAAAAPCRPPARAMTAQGDTPAAGPRAVPAGGPGPHRNEPAAAPATADPVERVLRALAQPAAASSDHDLTPGAQGSASRLRPAAVLVALMPAPDGMRLLLTRRSARLRHHPGQIALPGGRRDPSDPSLEATALREAHEEIGLHPDRVDLLGRLNPHETVTGFAVTPIVGRLRAPFRPVPEAGEVAEVFAVPLSHLTDPARYRIERRRWRNTWRNYYVVPWGPYYIWGATARILHGLATQGTAP